MLDCGQCRCGSPGRYIQSDLQGTRKVVTLNSAHQTGKKILGLVFYSAEISGSERWLLQYYESDRLFTVDLGIESDQAVMAAVADAAGFLSCRPENILVGDHGLPETEPRERSGPAPVNLEKIRGSEEPRALVYWAEDEGPRPGWHVQFFSEDRFDRLPLWQSDLKDVEAARTEAAWLLGCRPEEIQVGGDLLGWPSEE